MRDSFNGAHKSRNPEAIEAFSLATQEALLHGRQSMAATESAIEADAEMSAAHALRGLFFMLQAKPELRREAESCLICAQRNATTDFERGLADALGSAVHGQFEQTARILDTQAHAGSGQILAMKLSHQYRFMGGNLRGMLQSSRDFVANCPEAPGFGYALGCLSFALEESGHYIEARSVGLRALELNPHDAWAGHAVIHTFEMNSMIEEGLQFIGDRRDDWLHCNNFGYHLEWHYGLFLLGQSRLHELLEHYDHKIRPTSTDDFRDFANASSLLWRIEQAGFSVGDRWQELTREAKSRLQDEQLVFYMLHQFLTFLSVHDTESSATTLDGLRRMAEQMEGEQAIAAREVGLPLATLLCKDSRSAISDVEIVPLLEALPLVGGSHAQRDVFLSALALACHKWGLMEGKFAIEDYRSQLRQGPHTTSL